MNKRKQQKVISLILLCLLSYMIGIGIGAAEINQGLEIKSFLTGATSALFCILLLRLLEIDYETRMSIGRI